MRVWNRSVLEALKPDVSSRIRLFMAAMIWSLVGAGLSLTGLRWILGGGPLWLILGVGTALLLGLAKSRLLLMPSARANSERILAAGEHRCVGGTVSWGAWGLVAVMMLGGILLRHSTLPRPWLGVAYLAVGTALLRGSFVTWGYWHRAGAN